MMEIIIAVLFIMLFFAILKAAFKFAWGAAKFIFGLGLFFACPLLFVILAAMGLLGNMWILILIVALFCGGGFRFA